MKNALNALALVLMLTACDAVSTVKQVFQQSQAVAADLEQSVGSKPFVGFNWRNGVLASITINFDGVPKQKSLPEIAELSRASIKSHFKQDPKQIVLGFSITPQ